MNGKQAVKLTCISKNWLVHKNVKIFGLKKIRVLFESLNDDELEELMFKFVKWESKHQEMYYQRHILTNSAIFHILFEMIREYGTSIENDEMFPTESNEFRGFVFNLTHGQGSILWITYKGERIL